MPIPAVIGAVGALAATGLNSAANNYASAEQRNWLASMQDRTNRYNSPEHQRLLMRQGGANPALAMQNGMFASPTSQQTANYDRPQYDFSPVAESINTGVSQMAQRRNLDSQSRLTDENTIAQQQRNKFGLVSAYLDVCDKVAELKKKGADTSFLEKQASYMQKQIDAFDRRNNAEVNKIENEAIVAEKDAALKDLMISYQTIINEYLPKEKQGLLRIQKAQVEEIYSAAAKNDAEAAYAYAQKAVAEATKEGLDIDNDVKDNIVGALVDDAFNKAQESYWNSHRAYRVAHQGRVAELPEDLPHKWKSGEYKVHYPVNRPRSGKKKH